MIRYKIYIINIKRVLVAMIYLFLFVGCNNVTKTLTPPTNVKLIVNPNTNTVKQGQTVALTVEAEGRDLNFEWSVLHGTLSDPRRPAVIYTAPHIQIEDIVKVEVSNPNGEVVEDFRFYITSESIDLTPTPAERIKPPRVTPRLPLTSTPNPLVSPTPTSFIMDQDIQN